MTIKNMLTAAMFKTDDAGRTVVYPNGAMGRGYIVPDPATEQRMRRVMQWAIIGSGLIGGVGTQVMRMVYGQVFEWTGEPWGIALAAMMVSVSPTALSQECSRVAWCRSRRDWEW